MSNKYSHDSDNLDKYLGKIVKITFFDKDVKIGVLEKMEKGYKALIYRLYLGNCHYVNFAKTHVKKLVEEQLTNKIILMETEPTLRSAYNKKVAECLALKSEKHKLTCKVLQLETENKKLKAVIGILKRTIDVDFQDGENDKFMVGMRRYVNLSNSEHKLLMEVLNDNK